MPRTLDPAAVIEDVFDRNGWGDGWRNGIYDYLHYHSRIHEVLGIARGSAKVRLGGNRGRTLKLGAGDVVILPAGTGHQCLAASKDFSWSGLIRRPAPMTSADRALTPRSAKDASTRLRRSNGPAKTRCSAQKARFSKCGSRRAEAISLCRRNPFSVLVSSNEIGTKAQNRVPDELTDEQVTA